jgi:hypothetical protein
MCGLVFVERWSWGKACRLGPGTEQRGRPGLTRQRGVTCFLSACCCVADRALHEGSAAWACCSAWRWGALSATTAQTAKLAAIAIITPRPTILRCSRMLRTGTPERGQELSAPSCTASILARLVRGRICGLQAGAPAVGKSGRAREGAYFFGRTDAHSCDVLVMRCVRVPEIVLSRNTLEFFFLCIIERMARLRMDGSNGRFTAVLMLKIGIASGFESNTLLPRHMQWGGSLVPASGRLRPTSSSGCFLALRGAGGEDGEGRRGATRGGRHQVLVLLYMVYGIWYMVYGIWYMVYGIWYMVLYVVYGMCYVVLMWYLV